MRAAAWFLAVAALAPALAAPAPKPAVVEAVEFPYYLFPRQLWDRELVWLKNIGVRTVEFSIPWNWHQLQAGDFDFSGRTSPRRDLVGLIRTLRRLELHAWIRPLPPVPEWPGDGTPEGADSAQRRAWLQQLNRLLATQTASHGGPVEFVEGGVLNIDAGAPPASVAVISASSAEALASARSALASGKRTLLWTGVEDKLYPEGWAPNAGPLIRHGAVSLSGSEHPVSAALRRDAALMRHWAPLVASLKPAAMPKPQAGKFPESVSAVQLSSSAASAVIVTNAGKQTFHDDLRVTEPIGNHVLVIPGVTVRPGDSLWLPVSVSIGPAGLCRECSNFSGAEHIVYSNAELTDIEFENGILAMEFAAPDPAEVILQLARKPIGPYLAAGKPVEFDWDDHTLRARLKIPASREPGNRVRIGIAIEEPDTSGFFNEAHRLVIGQTNLISTIYSSADVAGRSRLRLPDGFTSSRTMKSPNEIDYQVTVPADELHGDFANLALEADGMPLGRAKLQLFRPASIRLADPIEIHYGQAASLAADPPTVSVDPKAGTNVDIVIRNNTPSIQTYHLQATGDGLDFFPAKTEISIGAVAERHVSLRIFGKDPAAKGLCDWRLRVTGGADLDLPMRLLLLPRGQTAAWNADLDGDGSPEWILESARLRAVFSPADGGRWIEFTWKDTNTNFLPDAGAFTARGPMEIHASGDHLEFRSRNWTRTVSLAGNVLAIEQTTPLPADGLTSEKRGSVILTVERPANTRIVYTLHEESR
jgi:hypothetical protein